MDSSKASGFLRSMGSISTAYCPERQLCYNPLHLENPNSSAMSSFVPSLLHKHWPYQQTGHEDQSTLFWLSLAAAVEY